MRAMEVSVCLSGAPLPGAQTGAPMAERQASSPAQMGRPGVITCPGQSPSWVKLHKSRRQRLYLILIEHHFQERTEDNQAWRSDLGRKAAPNLFTHGLLCRKVSQRYGHAVNCPQWSALVPGSTNGLCTAHMWGSFPSISAFNCALSNFLSPSFKSILGNSGLSDHVQSRLQFYIPLPHYRPGFGQGSWSME